MRTTPEELDAYETLAAAGFTFFVKWAAGWDARPDQSPDRRAR